ncbi:MAG: gliding motility-associated C-terminal domain-containing protein, partial [Bacteroidetes bacterium]|nr:gliding motility-associated C-terminal domain-containing protein [Bacteroidota bacterium]
TEVVSSLVVNAQNELMLSGVTGSNDFPVTSGAYDVTFNGGVYLNYFPNGTEYTSGSDLYVARFNAAGSSLLSSTYMGGSLNDGINSSGTHVYNYGDYYRAEIQLDHFGNCYISSCTYSANFPTTVGCAQPAKAGGLDGVVFKMDATLSSLLWSTYIGGIADDACYAIALDDSSNVYTTGGTASSNFPITAGALSTVYNGGITDGFITKIKYDGSVILNSTFIGTSLYDQSFFIQLDRDNDVYIIGQTLGVMPVSGGVYSNANSKQFIWKLNNSLSAQVFTLTGNAIQPTTDGFNFYLFVLSTDAASLIYATYFGGAQSQEHVDGGTSRFDKKGIIYQSVCAGCGGNDDFPVTPGSWPNTGTNVNHALNCNNGVFKFDFQVPIVEANFIINYTSGCAPVTVNFNNQSTPGSTFLWDFGGGNTTSVIVNPTITYTVPGTYLVQLYVNDPSTCNVLDTAYQYITVYPSIETNFDFVISPCINQVAFYDSSAVAPTSWLWYFDDGDSSMIQNPQHTYSTTGAYDVQLISSTINGCKDTAIVQVNFFETLPISVSPAATICKENTTQLTASGGFEYSWSPVTDLSDPSIPNPVAGPDTTTIYTVTVSSVNGSGDTCIQTATVQITVSSSPTMTSANTAAICNGDNLNIPLTSDISATYSWIAANNLNTTGESTTTQSGSPLNNTITNTTSSVETVTYTVTPTSSPQGCLGTPQTVTVSVNPSPAMTSPASATICNGNTISIPLTSDQASTYTWIAADNTNTTGESITSQTGSPLSNTIFNNTVVVQIITYTVTPTSSPQGCAGTPQTVIVTLTPSPTMTNADSATICDGLTVNIPLTSTMASTYTWIATDNANTTGESTTMQNDSLLSNTITNTSTSIQSVIYTVTPTLVSGTCAGVPQTVIVSVIPPPTITSPLTAAICSDELFSVPLTSNVTSTYSWVAADNANTTGESTTMQTGSPLSNTLTNNSTSVQTVIYTVTPTSSPDGCAGALQTVTITVYSDIIADFDFVKVPCTNQVTFYDSSAVAPASWLWYFDDGDSSMLQNPPHTYGLSGTYNVQLITSTLNGCSDTVIVQVNFAAANPVVVSANDTICAGNNTQLIASGGFSYLWTPSSSLSNPAISNPFASPDTTTTYSVIISNVDTFGDTCVHVLTTTIFVIDPSLYSIIATTDNDTLVEGQSTITHAITDTTLAVNWSPSTGLNNTNSFNPTATPEHTTTYTVSILDSLGCPKRASVTIYVMSKECDPADIFVPNTFTPNGDGNNDVLYVRGNEITELYFAVYNRWGELVFQTSDLKKGWEGTYKGAKADPAVFAWYINAKCFNGDELKKKGNVTLIR